MRVSTCRGCGCRRSPPQRALRSPSTGRLDLIREHAHRPHDSSSTRVAALLLLLFAQPVSTLLRLTIHDLVEHDDGQLLLRLGSPPTPVPNPSPRCCVNSAPPARI